jgi:hypothetical protein
VGESGMSSVRTEKFWAKKYRTIRSQRGEEHAGNLQKNPKNVDCKRGRKKPDLKAKRSKVADLEGERMEADIHDLSEAKNMRVTK